MTDGPARWGACGLAWLTGQPDGPPDFSRAEILARADRLVDRLRATAGVTADAATMLTGRAALLGLARGGRASAGSASRLLPAADGWWAITLSRRDDIEAVPALIGADVSGEVWVALADWAAQQSVSDVVDRARLLDIPAAALAETAAAEPLIGRIGRPGPTRGPRGALVVDLTSMWAGPLCGHLLVKAGATVIKVESHCRPDGTRAGPSAFFDWMNGGKLSRAVDFDRDGDFLCELLSAADIVLEGSRPTALARRGLGPGDVSAKPGQVWLQITAYGTDPGCCSRIGFGDDTAVSGGLVGWDENDDPVFCADAIADPLAGIEAAAAVVDSLARGGGELITLSLGAVAAGYAALPVCPARAKYPALPPQRPRIDAVGPTLGADDDLVRHLVAEARRPC